MFSLRGSRKRKTEEIIKKFLKSYAENEKSQDKKDLKTWLILELQNELPNKKVEDIEKIAIELISGIEIYYQKKKEVEKYQSVGITNGDYIGNEILEKINNTKILGNKFYSISIGNLFMDRNLNNIFTKQWVYNPNTSNLDLLNEIAFYFDEKSI